MTYNRACDLGKASFTLVTVTYSARWFYVQDLIEHSRSWGVNIRNIIIFDNASITNNAIITQLAQDPRIKIIRSDTNMGSSFGFNHALKSAALLDNDYVIILDDDNLPETNCIKKMLLLDGVLDNPAKTLILANRVSRKENQNIAKYGNYIIENPSSFMGFHVINKPLNALIKLALKASNKRGVFQYNLIKVGFAPYGGLLMKTGILREHGYPNPDFVLYFDDHEYTSRLINEGCKIFLTTDAIIEDKETSWDRDKSKGHFLFSKDSNESKLYYSIRNRVYLNINKRGFNKFTFFINVVIYLVLSMSYTLIFKRNVFHWPNRLKTITLAIRDGMSNKLGYDKKYNLD